MRRPLTARLLEPSEAEAVSAHLARAARDNLFLLELASRLGAAPAPGELGAELAGAFGAGELLGVAALRPSVVLDAGLVPEALEALLPYLESMGVGLIKSPAPLVDLLWGRLRHRRSPQVDRLETAYVLPAGSFRPEPEPDPRVRPALARDLEDLVFAARESLREEGRQDPFAGDAAGFRRWVAGRLDRARVVESGGRVVFAGYADVRRAEGWLVQGVYTWPRARRRGFAAAGMRELCREAFAAGADHVQLAVVDGNEAGRRLYEGLGFQAFGTLRTVLFR